MPRIASRAAWTLAALLSIGIALFSYRYVVGGPLLSDNVVANLFARPWLAIHALGAATALLIGCFQMLPALRHRRAIHRWLGRIYVMGCMVGGTGGLIMAFGTTAGPVAGLGFGLLAPIWIYTTGRGWLSARAGDHTSHRRWMIRSFSLTFAAVTLRLYLPIGVAGGLTFDQIYVATAWISWIPNLALAEWYLRRRPPSAPITKRYRLVNAQAQPWLSPTSLTVSND